MTTDTITEQEQVRQKHRRTREAAMATPRVKWEARLPTGRRIAYVVEDGLLRYGGHTEDHLR